MEKVKDNQFEFHFIPIITSSEAANKLDEDRDGPRSLSWPASACQSPFSSSTSDHRSSTAPFPPENGVADDLAARKNFTRKRTSFAYRIREHVRMGPNLSETIKGKLSVGAKIIKKGGRENLFWDVFGMCQGEKLLKASQCYLSTTEGPIAGILFISTDKVCFCSERSVAVHTSFHGIIRTPYKVCIPVKKIKGANESENVNKPAQKFIEIVTDDQYEFWFMGFVRYEKAMMSLHKAISTSMPAN